MIFSLNIKDPSRHRCGGLDVRAKGSPQKTRRVVESLCSPNIKGSNAGVVLEGKHSLLGEFSC